MDNKLKHLEFIQGAINRMSGNSFLLKGWSVTLGAALFALAAKDANFKFVAIAYYPILVFWVLDGYFLYQERLFRALYDKVRNTRESEIDFSMNTGEFKKGRNTWAASALSTTLLLFYVTVLVVMLFVARYIIG